MLYIVTHFYINFEYNLKNRKFIWVFSSEELVKAIIGYKSRNENGFKDHPNGFEIKKVHIDDSKNYAFELWKSKLFLLNYSEKWTDDQYIGVYSSKKKAEIMKIELLKLDSYKKGKFTITPVLLDLELWREWFISISEALDSIK